MRTSTSAPTPARLWTMMQTTGAVPLHWQARKADAEDRPANALAGGPRETEGGHAQQ